MGQLFLLAYIGLALLAVALILVIRKLVSDDKPTENNFGPVSEFIPDEYEIIEPAEREHIAYQDRQDSVFIAAIKKAPRVIMTTLLIQIFLMMFTGYLSVKNIERLAMAGSALSQGNYGMAISALGPMAKDVFVEQTRIAKGSDPYLDEKELYNFAYVGKLDGKKVAIMDHLYSTQDHDEDLTENDKSFGTVLVGLTAEKANSICDEKYNGQLISLAEWKLSRGHFLAAKNVEEYPKIPEWTRNVHEQDDDDYLVIEKKSGVSTMAVKEKFDNEEDGLYIDSDDLSTAGFRCSITWESDAGK